MTETSVAACGLFCGNCRKFKQGTCQGCAVQAGMGSCKIRACAFEKGFATCAECGEMETCKIRDNLISKLFEFVFRTDKTGSLRMMRDEGVEAFIAFKTAQGKM